jgi:branched-chain amino acid transport system substrate-binding protein
MTGETKILRRFAVIDRRAVVACGLGMLAAPAVLRAIPAEAQSKTIKIGHVSPRTGPLAGFGEADGFILDQVRSLLAKGLESGGKTYQVEIVSKDSQSSGTRASEVASELILRDKVDLIVASATPDTTNPVADQAEVNEVPCITTNCPWQPYFFGRNGDPKKGCTWTYHFFGASKTSSRHFWRCGRASQQTRWSVDCFRTTRTAMPGAIRSAVCRRHWRRPAIGSSIPAAIR